MKLCIYPKEPNSSIPMYYRKFLLPDFLASLSELPQGSVLSQSLFTASYAIWKIDMDIEKELVIALPDYQNQMAFLLPTMGDISILDHDGCHQLFKNQWAIVNTSGSQAKICKGRTTLWLTSPNGDYYHGLEQSLTPLVFRTTFLANGDVGLLDKLFLASAKTYHDSYIREVTLLNLYGRIIEAVAFKPIEEEEFEAHQLLALELKAYLEKNYNKTIRFENIKLYKATRQTFTRLFGCHPLEYLRNLRISEAQKLLSDTHQKIRFIAWEVGYESQAAFSRMFSAKTKQSPTAFRLATQRKTNRLAL